MIQPASKGPFVAREFFVENGEHVIAQFLGRTNRDANARYFAHAANVLPGCVEAMERLADAMLRCKDPTCPCPVCGLRSALDAARGER